jgi:hypothetical protein
MGGGLIQIVAYGAQDVYLTGNPQITFFKVVYRRHTNFACEAIEQTFNGTPALGNRTTVPITRNGDLVTKMWLKTTIATTDTLTTVETGTNSTDFYVLGSGTAVSVASGGVTTDLSFANSAQGKLTVTADAGDGLTDAAFPAGSVVVITDANDLYNGVYKVDTVTGNDNTIVLLANDDGTDTSAGNTGAASLDNDVDAVLTVHTSAETFSWGTDVGYSLINSIELQIGGTKIDKHYGKWMHIWSQLTKSSNQDVSHAQIIGPTTAAGAAPSHELFVPLQFFCCRNDGLALPLIALQYHDVRLEFNFETGQNTIVNLNTSGLSGSKGGNVSISNTSLLVNYIYLDSEERKRFAQASHEYLIEQLQFTGVETVSTSGSNKIRLNFNHPVKELIWAAEKYAANVSHFDFSDGSSSNPVSKAIIQLNGHDRFSEQSGKFFNYVQTHTHHSRTPSVGINVYSFALNPEEHQPSGTCNFSRIDNATLNVTTASSGSQLYVYGVNYNVLRIMSGMGGLAYSN